MKKFVLIGHPVGHSVSPAIHHAAYEQLNIDAGYTVVDCPDRAAVEAVIQRLRSGEIDGANVTVPWKQVAFELADRIDETAQRVGAANVLARDKDGLIVAYNTDASALSSELRECLSKVSADLGARPAALVLGNGGAARAAVVACQLAGISPVRVCARKFRSDQARELWPSGKSFQTLGAELVSWPGPESTELAESLASTGLIVQATSAGMKGTSGGQELVEQIPWEGFSRGALYDLVYNPPSTPFLVHGEELGLAAVGGLGMLVGQARDAIKIWLDTDPDPKPMMRAARLALGL